VFCGERAGSVRAARTGALSVSCHHGKTDERRTIRVGCRNNSQVEALSGLAPGERVIVPAKPPSASAPPKDLWS
jgi:multidrug efflux pump subunit AcrA (membrane-fusion protein)